MKLRGLLLLIIPIVRIAAQQDATLALARSAAAAYGSSLPDYVCDEAMERYNVGSNLRTQPRLADRVQAEVVYEGGKETFRNIRVNGRASESVTGGIWSVGVFGPLMASLFEPRISPIFVRKGRGREAGRATVRYDFTVPEANSNWSISTPLLTQTKPAYRGSIWIEESTGRILRHEIETVPIPAPFYYQRAALKVRYRFVRINGAEFLLPQSMESMLCPRGFVYCDRVEAIYTNCHKFSTESSINFDAE